MKNNLTDSIYKAWRTGILPLVTALLLLTGCEMDSDMDLPLNVDSNKYTLTSDAGFGITFTIFPDRQIYCWERLGLIDSFIFFGRWSRLVLLSGFLNNCLLCEHALC